MKSLYPYQSLAIEAIHSNLKKGVKSQLLVLPTQTGKTYTAVEAIKGMGRILWIAHTAEILSQSAGALYGQEVDLDNLPDNVGLIKADKFDISKQFTMASAQTLHNRLDRIPLDWFDVIVADEADLYLSRTFRLPIEILKPKLLLGLTATPYRQDNMPLSDLFEETVFEYSISQAVKDGYLCKPKAVRLKTSTNLDGVKTLAGEFKQNELSESVNTLVRNNAIVNGYLEHGEGRQFIAFCVDVQHCLDLSEAFQERGINCNFVVGDTELTPDRKKVLKDFANGEITGVANCMVLSVGYSNRNIGCEITACPTKSKRKFVQQVGRGLGLKDEAYVQKYGQNCIILDVVDATRKHKLVNCNTLDAELPLEDKIFISDSDRTKLLEVKLRREQQLNVIALEQDEKVDLIPLPIIKVNKYTAHLKLPAYPSQLKQIEYWGYDIENISYTIGMIGDIYASQAASIQDIQNLASVGYDVSNGVTVSEAKQAYKDTIERDKHKSLKK